MLRLGIDPEKLCRATFICQDGLCCCNMALISFRLFHKNLGNLWDVFGQMVYRTPPPPRQKNSRTPMVQGGVKRDPLFLRKHPEENKWYITVACKAGVFYSANDMVLIFFFGQVKKGFRGRGWWLKIKEGEGGGEEKIFLFSPSPVSFATAFKMAAAINVLLSFS